MKRTLIALTMLFAMSVAVAAVAHAADIVLTYRVTNGYNGEIVGHLRKTFEPANTTGRRLVNVSVDGAALGVPRTEVVDSDGRWLRHTIDNHGVPLEYEFSPALAVRSGNLQVGHSWTQRVNATVILGGEPIQRSVRVDGKVVARERIRVPAGEFDTLQIHRIVYAGDGELVKGETRINERVWYAPALGRSVRTDTSSSWRQSGCRRDCDYRGDWFIYELADTSGL